MMDIVSNALYELRTRESLQRPDNLPAFILARHILGVIPIDSTLDITCYIDEFFEHATEDDLMDCDGDIIERWEFEPLLRDAMNKVKYPAGREMDFLVERALKEPIPIDLAGISDPDGQLIARVCRVLQDDAGKKPFYLSQTNAGKIIKKRRAAGGRKLHALQLTNILQLVTKGHSGVASYYTCFQKASHLNL
jgi:hypothetical protein